MTTGKNCLESVRKVSVSLSCPGSAQSIELVRIISRIMLGLVAGKVASRRLAPQIEVPRRLSTNRPSFEGGGHAAAMAGAYLA